VMIGIWRFEIFEELFDNVSIIAISDCAAFGSCT
jgi:hypothetical protein